MSLLDEYYDDFVMLDKSTTSDGYGGFYSTYTEGATFKATATLNNSIEARIGGVQGLTSVYDIVTPRATILQYHDVIKRVSDNKVFRITSDGTDKKTPPSASLDMRLVSAEEWSVPNG